MSERNPSWRPVVGWEGLYEVSADGQVWGVRRKGSKGGILRLITSKRCAYPHVSLWINGKPETRYVHHLVMEAFAGPRPPGMETRHLNGDPSDNRWPENLAYGTSSENNYDIIRHGRNHNASKTHCKRGHEFTPENTFTSDGGRHCRECHRIRCHERYLRRKQETS